MNKLTTEQINYIIEEYGSSKTIISKIEKILGVYKFEEEEYYNLVAEIASEYETNIANKETHSYIPYNSLREIVIKVLEYKLKDIINDDLNYSQQLNGALNQMITEQENKKRIREFL